jgi:DNA-directed RNA polymerase specialized sigma subunit
MLLSLIPYYEERQYNGNYYDNDDLNDIRDAIARADLTDIQRRVINLTLIEDMTQTAAGKVLEISQRMVNYHEANGVKRVAEAYEKGKQNESN